MKKNIFMENMDKALSSKSYADFSKALNNIGDAFRAEYQKAENACMEWEDNNDVPEFVDDIPEYEALCNAEYNSRLAWEKANTVTEKMRDLFFALHELNKYMGE